jgi:lipoprotein-anchoring transpeptidase ErfK/SrfK
LAQSQAASRSNGGHQLTIRTLAALAALSLCAEATGQTYEADAGQSSGGEYGSLLRQATGGIEPSAAPAPSVQTPGKATPALAAKKRPPSKVISRAGEYLHDASEYEGERHNVRLVDRSKFDDAFIPVDLANTLRLEPGSIFVDVKARQLYFAKSASVVRRYGVAVGKQGAAWKGDAVVGRTAKWPDWRPTDNIRRENPKLKTVVKGGSDNPLGARALYLYSNGADTMFRIHGTNAPSSIGRFASHGCIRMINEDVIELHGMVRAGARVYVR